MAIELLDETRLVHQRAVEDHDLVPFHHAARELDHAVVRLGERVDEGEFLIVERSEHIVVAEEPSELGDASQRLTQLSRLVCYYENITR